MKNCHWNIIDEFPINSEAYLEDVIWEINTCLNEIPEVLNVVKKSNLRLFNSILTQRDILESHANSSFKKPLDSYGLKVISNVPK